MYIHLHVFMCVGGVELGTGIPVPLHIRVPGLTGAGDPGQSAHDAALLSCDQQAVLDEVTEGQWEVCVCVWVYVRGMYMCMCVCVQDTYVWHTPSPCDHRFKCPYCPSEQTQAQCRVIYF